MNRDTLNKISIILLSGVLFYPFLGGVHLFDWDEINFAEIAREMLLTGDYLRPQINFEPFWEKPPLFIWMQALSMQLFGINEFAARFPNAVCGTLSLLTLYSIGKKMKDERFGLWWVLAYVGSILPHLYFRSGIIDPWFNLFIFLGIIQYLNFREKSGNKSWIPIAFSGFFIGLAVLTKGPVALLIFGLCGAVFGLFTRFRKWLSLPAVFIFALTFVATNALWYGVEIARNGTWFVEEFITYQIRLFQTKDAGHGGFPGYHGVILLAGCFPASAFALSGLFTSRNAPKTTTEQDFRLMMKILFWVVLILFSVVSTKIVHYSSLCYFPLTFIAAQELYRLSTEKERLSILSSVVLGIVGGLFVVAALAFPILLDFREKLLPYFNDSFAAEAMFSAISAPWYLYVAGIFILAVLTVSHFKVRSAQPENGYRILFLGNALAVAMVLYLFIGRAEMFSQYAHIEFLKTCAEKNIPVQTAGFKSYAQYFYGKSTQTLPGWKEILNNEFDGDVYLVAKVNKEKELDARSDLEKTGRKNGFVFYFKKGNHAAE